MIIKGYAVKYNTLSQSLGGFFEKIEPGAFDKVLRSNPDVTIRFNHDDNLLLGRTSSGTASVESDEIGLLYTCSLPKTQTGNDVGVLVRRRDVTGSSFTFYVKKDEFKMENGKLIRHVIEASGLLDCAPVTNPAYLSSTVKEG